MFSRKNRCFDTKHNKLKAFLLGSFLAVATAFVYVIRYMIFPFKEMSFDLILLIGVPLVFLCAFFGGLKYLQGAVNTRIEITEKAMNITVGKSVQSFNIKDFVGFLPVNEYEYFDSPKFLVFKHGADNDSRSFLLPGMTDEHYSYVLLCGVNNRQYKKLMIWLPSILKDMNIEIDKNGKTDYQPLSYEKLMEEYSHSTGMV